MAALSAGGIQLLSKYHRAYDISDVARLPAYLQPRVRWPRNTLQVGDTVVGQVVARDPLPEQAYLVTQWEYPPPGITQWPPEVALPGWAKGAIRVQLVPVPPMSRIVIGHKQVEPLPMSTTPKPQVWATCMASEWRQLWRRARQPRQARIEHPVFYFIHAGQGKGVHIDLCARMDENDSIRVANLDHDLRHPWASQWLKCGPQYRLYVAPGWHLYPRGEALSILVDGYYAEE